ncbi:MAG: MFS transporter [Rickettsiaceae bacterium]|nr:MFS transporter [Rickettsiaceae bacterium]MDP4832442.1 MFS transporter [Rickettsiaceae bacterium]MDP5020422.1 MFS transporter [Rickettsiaceae bacterium]MDP5083544.1 MFS transporter [Rickettsiaceae bacterium]
MIELSKLDAKTKESIFLLQIGTFLEYFDLMLFVHMAVILNELFFPQYDPFTTSLLSAFAFCSTFAFKPIGALLFGYIGDKVGRKHTVVITTMIMAISCLIMANVPTYAQIGITASWVITICRALQGMSCIGESVGAELYTAEMIKPPLRYRAVGLIGFAGVVGMVASLIVARIVLGLEISWRIIFWIGALIALIGSVARVTLRESPEFSDAKRKMQQALLASKNNGLSKAANLLLPLNRYIDEKVCQKTSLAYFMVFCGWPFCFYFSYVYCGGILKNQFSYTKEALINHNLIVSLFNLVGLFIFIWLTKRIHPLVILKWKLVVYIPFICIVPWLLSNATSATTIFVIQVFGVVFGNSTIPAKAIFLMHFPVFKRFRYASFITAMSHILLYIITSFGLVYAVSYFGNYGILFISLPATTCFFLGILYFIKLEKEIGNYPLEYKDNKEKIIIQEF